MREDVKKWDEIPGNIGETSRLWAQAKERARNSLMFEYYLLEHEKSRLHLSPSHQSSSS